MKLVSSRRFALLVAVPVILIASAVFLTARLQRNAALLGAREQVASQQLLTAMLDQETGARGYFQTKQKLFLQPWFQGTTAFASSSSQLYSLLAGDATLSQMLDGEVQRADGWHISTQAAISQLERTGRVESTATAEQGKRAMDGFRAAQASFDVALGGQRSHSQFVTSGIAVAVAFVLAALLATAGLLLARRMARNEEARQRDQSELRELLQASESERESRGLLIDHIEKLVPGAGAAVLNRNNSNDRLEITRGGLDSPLQGFDTEQVRPRSCMAVRLSRTYDQDPSVGGLQRCELCGKTGGTTTCEPLLVDGKVIGSVLVVTKKRLDTTRRIGLRDSVAQAAPILANQRNLAIAEGRAASDALTGLPNRRAADEVFKRMAAHAGRSITPLTAILLDLDRFKRLNDQNGHEAGDRALALVGRIIASAIRTSDFVARFGGEEFLVLLPDTDGDSAVLVAEKLRNEIAQAELVGIGSISASLGLAVLPSDAVEPDELLRKADRALYAAKDAGRNCVRVFSQLDSEVELQG